MRDLISVLKLFDTETMNPNTVDITRTDSYFAFWTRTLWNDQDAMRVFMLSGAHRRMMPRLLNWCDEASVAHWTQDSLETPSWQEVHGRMQAQGRPLKGESSLRGSAAV
jgi:uncharacterized protein DUF3291